MYTTIESPTINLWNFQIVEQGLYKIYRLCLPRRKGSVQHIATKNVTNAQGDRETDPKELALQFQPWSRAASQAAYIILNAAPVGRLL